MDGSKIPRKWILDRFSDLSFLYLFIQRVGRPVRREVLRGVARPLPRPLLHAELS